MSRQSDRSDPPKLQAAGPDKLLRPTRKRVLALFMREPVPRESSIRALMASVCDPGVPSESLMRSRSCTANYREGHVDFQ